MPATTPLAAEYAKSAKAGCKCCKENIAKGALRVGFVGKANFGATAWYHYDCVWKQRENLKHVDGAAALESLVDGVECLDKTDREKLGKDLPKYCEEAKNAKPEVASDSAQSKPLAAEYAKSGKSTCKFCGKTIEKGSLRVGFTGKANFGATAWYHEACIWKVSDPFSGIDGSREVSDIVEGFADLRAEAQEKLKTKIPEVCRGSSDKSTKRKSTSDSTSPSDPKKAKK